jgi:hypothetical protein
VAEAAEAARVVSGSAALRDAQAASALAQLDTCARALCKLAPLPGYEGDMDALRSGHPPVTVCTLLGGTHSIERCKSRES